MKAVQLTAGFLLFASLLFTSCTKDSTDYGNTTREILSEGKWSVDYFFAGQDKTDDFNSYHFKFSGNGSVTGSNGIHNFNGNWNIIKDPNNKEILQITILSQEPQLTELNEDWHISGTLTNLLELHGNGNKLRFKKL